MGGREKYNCTHDDLSSRDLSFPCRLFMRELDFNKMLSSKLHLNEFDSLRRSYTDTAKERTKKSLALNPVVKMGFQKQNGHFC